MVGDVSQAAGISDSFLPSLSSRKEDQVVTVTTWLTASIWNQTPSKLNIESKRWHCCLYLHSSSRERHLPHPHPSQTMEPRKGSIFPVLTKRPSWQWVDFQPCWASQISEIWAANIYQTLPVTQVREYQSDIPSTCSSNHSWSWIEVGRPSVFHFKTTDGVERAQCTHVTWGVLGFSPADGIVLPKTETSSWFCLTTWFSCWRSSCETHLQRASGAVVGATIQELVGVSICGRPHLYPGCCISTQTNSWQEK